MLCEEAKFTYTTVCYGDETRHNRTSPWCRWHAPPEYEQTCGWGRWNRLVLQRKLSPQGPTHMNWNRDETKISSQALTVESVWHILAYLFILLLLLGDHIESPLKLCNKLNCDIGAALSQQIVLSFIYEITNLASTSTKYDVLTCSAVPVRTELKPVHWECCFYIVTEYHSSCSPCSPSAYDEMSKGRPGARNG